MSHLFGFTCSVVFGQREGHCKQNILLVCVCVGGLTGVWTTLGLLQSRWYVLHRSTLLGSRVFCKDTVPKWRPCILCLPRSATQVLPGTLLQDSDRLDHAFVSFPGPSSSGDCRCLATHYPWWAVHLNHLPVPASQFPGCTTRNTISGVSCVSYGEYSICNTPG